MFADVMEQQELLEESKAQSETTGPKDKEHYVCNLCGVERIERSRRGKGGQKEGLL